MTFGEAEKLQNNTPIRLKDGAFGLVIRWWPPDELGIQVPCEEDIRVVKVENIISRGDAYIERPAKPES